MSEILKFKNISKNFGPVEALKNVSFEVNKSEVLALVGENGAGKSTLLKILNGDYQQTSGSYVLDGVQQQFSSPNEAIQAGIGLIYQERQLAEFLSVAENIFMGNLPTSNGIVNFNKLYKDTNLLIKEFGLDLEPTENVKNLSVAMQQMVEIMKVYSRKPKVIAFDEPTASLTDNESQILFKLINELKRKGIAVIYVSHRMNEIFELSDKIVVLKDGVFIGEFITRNTVEDLLVEKMIGRPISNVFSGLKRNHVNSETILEVNSLYGKGFNDINFSLKKGEILGFFGLVGAGRTELMRGIFGADPILSGEIKFNGKNSIPSSPRDSIQLGIAFLSEDRKNQGIIPLRSVKDNISLMVLKKLKTGLLIDNHKETELAKKQINVLNIKTSSHMEEIKNLSGGNQQKTLLARCLSMDLSILILDEPTKGIDVGSKSEIYKLINEIANSGVSIILISSELPEIIGLSDRIIVMRNKLVTGNVTRYKATEEVLLRYAMLDVKEITT